MSEKQKILLFIVSLKPLCPIFTQEKLEAESDLCH